MVTDPYREWARCTQWKRLKPGYRWPAELSFVVERVDNIDWSTLREWLAAQGIPGRIDAAYDRPLADGSIARFATLRLATMPTDTAAAVDDRVDRVAACSHIARIQLGYPRGAAEAQAVEGTHLEAKVLPTPAEVVIGIIDDGCPFAHPALLDAKGEPRVAAVWQQTTRDPATVPWQRPTGFGHGRVLDRAAMLLLMDHARPCGELDERLLYELAYSIDDSADGLPAVAASWRKPSRALLGRASHGAAVMALAAAPVRAAYDAQDTETRCHRPHGQVGATTEAATRCPIVCVDLPREQVEISSGRWMPVNALDGMRFIEALARDRYRAARGGRVPVVINLSSGAAAGAHAGEAMFERAMDELLAADDHLAITLAAGNSRESDAHAVLNLTAGGSAQVGLFVPSSHPFDTCVELWLPPGATLADLTVTVTDPGGSKLRLAGDQPDRMARLAGSGSTVLAALFLYPQVVQATTRTMAMLAIGGTTSTSTRTSVPRGGPWIIDVHNAGNTELTLQGWIERDEVVFGMRREQVARFFSLAPARPDPKSERRHAPPVELHGTLSNIATGKLALPVAAYRGRARTEWQQGRELAAGPMARYSGQPADPPSNGPCTWLPLAAVADAGQSHPGVRAAGNRGDTIRRMNGTSAAAPQAARWLANQMALGHTRSTIVAGLPPAPASGSPSDGRLRV